MSKNPVVHFEMPYEDAKRAADFYTNAFGWTLNQLGEEMGNYLLAQTAETDENNMVKTPGTINGGFSKKSEQYQHPSVVISVENLETAMQSVAGAGGTVLGEPMPIPGIGRFVAFTDTEGNRVGMLEPAAGM